MGVRSPIQCPLSPTPFHIHKNGKIQKSKRKIAKSIKLTKNKMFNTILYTDNALLIAETKQDPQRAVHQIHQICKECDITVYKIKNTEVKTYWVKHLVWSEIVVENTVLEHVMNGIYLGRETAEKGQRTEEKNTKGTRVKFYKYMGFPILFYESESRVALKRNK